MAEGKTLKTWDAKLLKAGASLDVRVRERKEAIRPWVWGPWQSSEWDAVDTDGEWRRRRGYVEGR